MDDSKKKAIDSIHRGLERHRQGDYSAAIADYTAALTIEPNFPEAYNNRGVARHALGDDAAAIADFDEALRLVPAYAEAWNNRGVSRHALRDFAGALVDFDEALRLEPGYAEAYNNRGSTHQSLNDLLRARADFDAALRLAPQYAEALDNRGNLHYLQWRHAEAVADFTQALAAYGSSARPAVLCRLHVCRGDASYHAGNMAGLVADYAAAFRIDADRASELVVERLAKDAEANFSVLLANCDRHLRTNPNDFIVHARRGLVYLLVGRDDEAQHDFDLYYAKRLNPPALTKALIERARQYRDRHGPVVPGDAGLNS